MDFVVAGLGIGALMVVIGFVVRDLGPVIGRQNRTTPENPASEQRSQALALLHEIARSMCIGGGVIIVATFVAVVLGLSDSTGTVVVLVAAVLGIGFAAATIVRSLVGGGGNLPAGRPGLAGRAPALVGRDRPAAARSEPAPAARRVKRKRNEPSKSPEFVAAPKEPQQYELPPEEPFDPARLLPYEFDEELSADSVLPGFSDNSASESKAADVPVVATPDPEEQAPDEVAADAHVEEAMSPAGAPVAESPSSKGIFKSALLADIGVDPPQDALNGEFVSRLFSDVDARPEPAETFQSPLLADLAREAAGEPANTDPRDGSDEQPPSGEPVVEESPASTTPERG